MTDHYVRAGKNGLFICFFIFNTTDTTDLYNRDVVVISTGKTDIYIYDVAAQQEKLRLFRGNNTGKSDPSVCDLITLQVDMIFISVVW